MLSKKMKLRQENPDLLEPCHTVPMEVIVAEKSSSLTPSTGKITLPSRTGCSVTWHEPGTSSCRRDGVKSSLKTKNWGSKSVLTSLMTRGPVWIGPRGILHPDKLPA